MMEKTEVESEHAGMELEYGMERDGRKITHMLETYEPNHSSKCSIYRIPDNLRKVNEAAYTPQVVSIGPIHHNNSAFQTMEMHKVGYLQSFLKRTKTSLNGFIVYIADCEDRVRCCYAQTFRVDDFRSMLLLDGIFILEYLLMAAGYSNVSEESNTTTLYQPLNIESDLILLENQLPFFLLVGLYNLAFPPHGNDGLPSFLELACKYFDQYNYIDIKPQVQVEHFTDLLRKFHPRPILKDTTTFQPDHSKQVQWTKSATVLHEAGVKFRVRRWRRLCDIQFNDGVLEIPRFTFQSSTESFIRNLMALEQCHYPQQTYICHYFFFMDNLINTAKDVDLLVENGIIINWLGDSDAVANLVNKLPINVLVFSFGSHAKLCKALNAYCDVRWHSWKVAFKRDYLSTPWKIASTTAAVILLLLTFIQTVCSIISLTA